MRKILFSLSVVLLLCFSVNAQEYDYCAGAGTTTVSTCSGSNPTGCLFYTTFDSCSGTAENDCVPAACDTTVPCLTYSVGRCTLNDTTSPLEGTQSASCGGAAEVVEGRFTPSTEVYAVTIFDTTDVTATTDRLILADESGTAVCKMEFSGSSIVVRSTGGTAKYGTEDFSNGTKYYLKLRGKTGTGANAECQGWASTDGQNWTFSTPAVSDNGTWTADIARVRGYGSSATLTSRYDDLRVDTKDINY